MKKCIAVIISVISMLCLAGCQKTIQGSEVYTFPEPTIQVTGTFYSAGTVTEFVIGSDKYDPDDLSTLPVLEWFYRLEMITCEKPEDVEGGEVYGFYVNDENVFDYVDRGKEVYVIASGAWYQVKNPSKPPIEISDFNNEYRQC